LPADEAEAVLIDAARTVARSKEVQLVDHVVVPTDKGL
jgi:cob(I)alamin adenosyltransferase